MCAGCGGGQAGWDWGGAGPTPQNIQARRGCSSSRGLSEQVHQWQVHGRLKTAHATWMSADQTVHLLPSADSSLCGVPSPHSPWGPTSSTCCAALPPPPPPLPLWAPPYPCTHPPTTYPPTQPPPPTPHPPTHPPPPTHNLPTYPPPLRPPGSSVRWMPRWTWTACRPPTSRAPSGTRSAATCTRGGGKRAAGCGRGMC